MARASEITIADVKAVFFRAVRSGWIAGNKGVPIEGRPGSHSIEYREDDWLVIDEYCTTLGRRSDGTIRIWFRNVLVWSMHYWGEYEESVIPFLMEALIDAYAADCFYGGRGRYTFTKQLLRYRNSVSAGSDFTKFEGLEEITDLEGVAPRGYHDYGGMLMVNLPLPDSRADQIIHAVEQEMAKFDFSPVFAGEDIEIHTLEHLEINEFHICILDDTVPLQDRVVYFYLIVPGCEVDGEVPMDWNSCEETARMMQEMIVARVEGALREEPNFADLWEIA
jgi:hypothetical protein